MSCVWCLLWQLWIPSLTPLLWFMVLLMLFVMVFLFCGWYSTLSCRYELLWRLILFGSCKFHYQLLHFKYVSTFFPILFFFYCFSLFFFHVCCFLVSCIYLFGFYMLFFICFMQCLMSSSPLMSLNLSKSIYPMSHLLPNTN